MNQARATEDTSASGLQTHANNAKRMYEETKKRYIEHLDTAASTSHFINDTQRRKALADAMQALDDADQLHSIYIVLANMAQRSQSTDALKDLIR